MNLSEQLMAEMSRRNIDYIVHYIGNDPQLFKDLMDIVWNGSPPLPQRAAWAVSHVTDKYPELLKPYIKKIINRLEEFDHPGVRRSFVRYIAEHGIPPSTEGKLYDICSRWLMSRDEPIAIKAHCMQIMFNIAEKESDLKNELKLMLEELITHESAGIKSRSQYLLEKL